MVVVCGVVVEARCCSSMRGSPRGSRPRPEPVVTLLHYAHPRWFHERTPWTSPASVDAFQPLRRPGRARARPDGPLLDGPERAVRPRSRRLPRRPGASGPGLSRDAARAFDNLLAAHEAAAAEIREAVPGAAIGKSRTT